MMSILLHFFLVLLVSRFSDCYFLSVLLSFFLGVALGEGGRETGGRARLGRSRG